MENLDYKNDIVATRQGHLGGSDAKLIQQCAESGLVPKSAYKRMAVLKGFIENPTFTNKYMQFGDFVENQVFESLKNHDERWQSNPCLVSKKYSKEGLEIIDHVDFLLQDDEKKVLTVAECKATRLTFAQTRAEYIEQLCHHYILANELAKELGGYSVKIILAHYCTEGMDWDAPFEFDSERLTVKQLRDMEKTSKMYDIEKGVEVISNFLETFDSYYEEETIQANMLPSNVYSQFGEVAQFLREIKERESKVEAFKVKLYDFLSKHGISKVMCDDFAFTVVAPTQQVGFDYKTYLQDIEEKHPRVAKKLREQYTKVSNKKGYVKISVSDNKNS